MVRKRDGLVPIGIVFTQADQVNQLVSASEADPERGFMARMMALCSLPRTNPGNRKDLLIGGLSGRDSPGLELPSRAGVGLLQRSIKEIDDLVNEVKRGLVVKQDHEDGITTAIRFREV